MLKSILSAALLSSALTGAAFAGAAVPANDAQAAYAAGVQPGQYTAAELQIIQNARQENDATKLNFYLSGANRTAGTSADSAGAVQMAKIAGVEPGKYTLAELTQILDAQQDNDLTRLSFYLSGANRVATPQGVTAAKAQLAAIAGVDPAAYTLPELVAATDRSAD